MNTDRLQILNRKIRILAAVVIMIGLYVSSLYHYLLFHSLAEIFSIVVAFGIFIITLNARQFIRNGYLLFIGTAYLFIGIIDLIHTLAYEGMPIFAGCGTNLATQLWIAARYMEGLTMLVAIMMIRRRVRVEIVFYVYTLITTILLLTILQWKNFPVSYIEGIGITPFKKISEYIICLILITSLWFLQRYREEFDKSVFRWITFSIALTIASELFFTFYMKAYDLSNLIGHYLKVLSFYCMYKAIIEICLTKPYDLMFRELKISEERYRSLFTNMMDGFARQQVIFDDNGNPVDFTFLEVNSAFEKMSGIKKNDLIGKKITEIAARIKMDPTEWIRTFGKVSITGESLRNEYYLDLLKKYYSVMVYSHEKGYFVTIFQDITKRKIAEEKLESSRDYLEQCIKEQTAELKDYADKLELKNKELEEFTYVASHDLQEPLRKIQMFGSKLESLDGEKLSEKSLDYIHRMIKASNRMRKLVQDLLVYSRLSVKPQTYNRIDLREAIDRAIENLEAGVKQSGAKITIDDLPKIDADSVQMTQLFQNLIGNALKFSGNNTSPKIEITCKKTLESGKRRDQFYEIQIKDNGIGFDQKYTDKIFQPFERLKQGGNDDEGTGIGLSICKRIVERHGGSITAKSVPGKGTIFIVVLPAFQSEHYENLQQDKK